MALLIGFLSFVLVLNCLILALLVLIQLPKKEAGAGVAFGASATDALFGAGSGNALTKATRYAATIFMCLAIALSLLWSRFSGATGRRLEQVIQQQAGATPPVQLPSVTNQLTPAPVTPSVITTNLPAVQIPAPTPGQTPAPVNQSTTTEPGANAPATTAPPAGVTPPAEGTTPATPTAPATPPQTP